MFKNNLKALISHLVLGGITTLILFVLDKVGSFALPMVGSIGNNLVNGVVSTLGIVALFWYVFRGLRLKDLESVRNNMLSVMAVSLIVLTINLLGNVIQAPAYKFIETLVNAPLFVMAKSADFGVKHMPYWFSFMPTCFISMGLLMKYGVKRAIYAGIKAKAMRQGAEA